MYQTECKPLPTGRCYWFQGKSRFTSQKIESGSTPLAVLVALEVVFVIVVILRDGVLIPVFVADISRQSIAGQAPLLDGLSDAGPMIVTEEDRRRRRRRQLRALKATLKIASQECLYRVCLRRAWKTEREIRSRDQSTTSSRSYDIPLDPYIFLILFSILILRLSVALVSFHFLAVCVLSLFQSFLLIINFLLLFCV